ncbi:AMP-binding protein [Halomonas aquamarina]|uniref:condensation domain-containing protein n=2 Tax=Oceanospirillales TaxID=135619 RepID=UPI000AE94402|nr:MULTISPECIES: condensation domain-containing protein [Halomonas]MCC4291218.1 condensation domain-containing protein [Halomonas axialensis]MCF2913656.1 condensation domain-containing protein [Halomonas sp. Cn5-12]MCO7241434.1 condensation domain-containing protein [Halomonas sp. Ps84H-12]MCP1304970.1 condensation domain-containing protein [Halomonas sp. R1t8]MDC8443226.1 AMP-binding protein [Halomonas aquamarina]
MTTRHAQAMNSHSAHHDVFISYVEHLSRLSQERPGDRALVTVNAQGETILDYATLERRSRALASELQQRFPVGERALILLDNDEHYVVAFLACLYAGVIAVPVFPPESAKQQHLARLFAIADDSQAACVLTSSAVIELVAAAGKDFGSAELIPVDALDERRAECWVEHHPQRDDIAFLQYTSGSTATPKGVMVSHGNLMANERAIETGFSIGADDVFVSWLPLYHDMGLIGGLLQPLYRGIPVVLMSPSFFLQRPVRWLEAISRHRGTVSGGPDFAYRLCLERIRDDQLKALDLSSWRVAFSGAEPVRHDTLTGFIERFRPAGFAADAAAPCYGLAEATLLVSCNSRGTGVVGTAFSQQSLAEGKAASAVEGNTLVGCGTPEPGHTIDIVDPEGLHSLTEGDVGEIWVNGPSVAHGYWQNPEATAQAFVTRDGVRWQRTDGSDAQNHDARDDRWLRTGDLGFLHEGQLYIAGRIKDLIILRGHNVYPQDIESAIEAEVEAVRKGRVAAFAVTTPEGAEGIGVAAEVSRGIQKLVPAEKLIEALSEAVGSACHEPLSVALLLNPGGLPKTSSGKLQRSACRQGWEAGSLDAYAIHAFGDFVSGGSDGDASGGKSSQSTAEAGSETEQALAKLWCQVLGDGKEKPLGRDAHFFASGGNSLAAVQLASRISDHWAIDFPTRAVMEKPRFGDVVDEVERRLATPLASYQGGAQNPLIPISRHAELPLAPVQRRLWLVDRLASQAGDRERAAYNLPALFSLKGELNIEVLERTVNAIVARHEALRTHYPESESGDPIAVVEDQRNIELPVLDCSDLAEQEQQRYLQDTFTEYANTPLDLATGPLIKAGLLRFGAQEHALILVIHHIVFDGWSTSVFIREFASLYGELLEGKESGLPEVGIQYVDYAAWHEKALSGEAFEQSATFWRRYLSDAPPLSTLPGDFARPGQVSHAGSALSMTLSPDLSQALNKLATQRGTTLFTLLLASFQLLMHRQTRQHDLIVGTDVAGRSHPDVEPLIGFFVNVIPLRSRLSDGQIDFGHWLEQVQTSVLDAFDHQNVPFDRIVELSGIGRERDRSPLIQTLFVLQNTPTERFSIPGLEVEVMPQPRQESKFDMAIFVNESDTGLSVEWVYATALYRRETIEHLTGAWQSLLAQIVEAPNMPVEEFRLPLMEKHAMQNKLSKGSKLNKLGSLKSQPGARPSTNSDSPIRTALLDEKRVFPLVIEATDADLDAVAWATSQRDFIEQHLRTHAGILFRNFGLTTPQEFEAFAEAIQPGLYGNYGDLPKKEGGRNTYRSTPYPERQMILYHNESSHLERWPRKQLFFCEFPSPVGGATPIVDCREMLRQLPSDVVEEFERKGLLYVRTFTRNLDVSWRDFFKTDSKEEVEARLKEAGIEWQWLGDDELQTRTRCPAVVTHPVTGGRVFFNQVQLHHVSCLEPDVKEDLLGMVGQERLPRNVYFGDGSVISDEMMKVVGEAYEACAVRFDWRRGDVVMVDNMLAAHARDPYEGPRKIVVAMGDIYERSALEEAQGASADAELVSQ